MSAKPKKMSKAEKEKLKKEEEDKKLKEEEEARLLVEAEENAKKEKEQKEQEERRQLENEERKRRKGQLQELEELWSTNRLKLVEEGIARRKEAKWARYMLCDGSPDPTVAREINTYINLWREDKENYDINTVLKECTLTLKLIKELMFILEDTPEEELNEAEQGSFRQTKYELEELVQEKLDLASYDLLLQATKLADIETMNLLKVIPHSDGTIVLCAWGNLSKNPRIKSFEFAEKGMTIEIPKVLTLSDCAVRVLFTEYDHYSQHCKNSHLRKKKYIEPVVEEEGEKKEGEEEVEKKEGDEATEETENKEDGEAEEKPPAPEEETEELMKELEDVGEDGEEKVEETEKQEEGEPMEEDYEIKTPDVQEWEDFDGDEDVIDLRAYSIMGPIFHFDLLQLPPQPKNVHDWVMTILEEPALRPLDYVVDVSTSVPPPSQASNPPENESQDGESKKREEKPPISVAMKLPKDVYFCEEPQVARWDHARQEWLLDGFSDHSFDEENRVLTFKTAHFGVMALMQDSHINMPFQSWEIRPRGQANHAIMTVIAAIVEIEIEIKDDGNCCLMVQDDRPELDQFKDLWIPAKDLVLRLKKAGINVFPEPDSHKYVSVKPKNAITEERLYQQMAMTASAMAYSWSKWNMEVDNDQKIVVQGAESLEDEPLLEEDWSLFLITKLRTKQLKMTEFDVNFSEDHAEGTEFHADLFHMTQELCSDEGKSRLLNTNYKFTDAVYTLLRATSILTYA